MVDNKANIMFKNLNEIFFSIINTTEKSKDIIKYKIIQYCKKNNLLIDKKYIDNNFIFCEEGKEKKVFKNKKQNFVIKIFKKNDDFNKIVYIELLKNKLLKEYSKTIFIGLFFYKNEYFLICKQNFYNIQKYNIFPYQSLKARFSKKYTIIFDKKILVKNCINIIKKFNINKKDFFKLIYFKYYDKKSFLYDTELAFFDCNKKMLIFDINNRNVILLNNNIIIYDFSIQLF